MKIALVLEKEDNSFLSHLKPIFAGPYSVDAIFRRTELLSDLTRNYDAIISTREDLLQRVTFNPGKRMSIDSYAGSLFSWGNPSDKKKKDFLFIDPLERLVQSPQATFITKRYIDKILKPNDWFPQSEFTWELADELTIESLYHRFSTANIIAIDIETTIGAPWIIKCVGYCGIWFDNSGGFTTHTVVIPFTNMFWVSWVRRFNDLEAPKVFQNGLFDNQYFFRFGCPVRNWLLDTLEFFHAWYSELPKSLDYITAFLLRNVQYWKDEGKTGDLKDLYKYNGKDCWATANSILAILTEAPAWAIENYKIKYPMVFPCIAASFEGIRYDLKKVNQEDPESLYCKEAKKIEDSLGSLRAKLGMPNFNPGSSPQTLQLIHLLGEKSFTNADKKVLAKVAKKHPLNNLLVDEIFKYRKAKKLNSTYLGADLIAGDRFLYSLDPSGTDTGRLASRKHVFGVGNSIQVFPEFAKQAVLADEGFYLAEPDNQKSEAVCLAYISGDKNLIEAVNSDKDFHSINIERFFGVAYETIWDSINNKTSNKPLRDLSKRVNHGTAYVMGEGVLLETMGLENVVKAQILLGLPTNWSPLFVCKYLLERYHLAYPGVKADFYEWVKAYVKINRKLVSALDWTRFCFGQPWNNSRHFKALVAHVPQNLSVGIINRGMLRVFNQIQRPNWKDFRIKAQVHDSMPFQYRIGRVDLAISAARLMEETVPVTCVKGVTRQMRIPVALKGEHQCWAELKDISIK